MLNIQNPIIKPSHKAPLILILKKGNKLYTLLKKYESLFGDNLGKWHGNPYDIKHKPDAELYHEKTFLFRAYMNSRSNKNSIDSRLLRS